MYTVYISFPAYTSHGQNRLFETCVIRSYVILRTININQCIYDNSNVLIHIDLNQELLHSKYKVSFYGILCTYFPGSADDRPDEGHHSAGEMNYAGTPESLNPWNNKPGINHARWKKSLRGGGRYSFQWPQILVLNCDFKKAFDPPLSEITLLL